MEDLDPAQHSGGVGPAAAAFQLQQPLAIRRLLPIPANPEIPNDPSKFTFKFLQKHLKGASMTPCLFTSMNTNSLAKAYYAINRDQEPYLPQRPGEHGAKLSAFMVELDEWPDNIPLFVGELSDGVIRYTYFGTYRSPRWSDRLDYDRMMEAVPMHVKRWHAGDLARRNRPAWLHDAMKRHFWPLREGDEDAEEWMEELTEERVLKCFEEVRCLDW